MILRLVVMALLFLTACADGEKGSVGPASARGVGDTRAVVTLSDEATIVITTGQPVLLRELAFIVTNPADIRIRPGASLQVEATGFGLLGQELDDVRFEWELLYSFGGSVDLIEPDGSAVVFTADEFSQVEYSDLLVTATQIGNTVDRPRSLLIPIEIVPKQIELLTSVESIFGNIEAANGRLIRLLAIALNAVGRVIPRARLQWTISDPSLGKIIGSELLEVAGPPGVYHDVLSVKAVLGDESAEQTVDLVVSERLQFQNRIRIYVTPSRPIVVPGEEIQFRSIVIDGFGNLVETQEEIWSVANSESGVIDVQGSFRAGTKEGRFADAIVVNVTSNGQHLVGRSTLTVRRFEIQELRFVDVIPPVVVVARGNTSIFGIQIRNARGRLIRTGVDYRWEVVNHIVGRLTTDGILFVEGPPGFYPKAIRGVATQRIGGSSRVVEDFADVTIVGPVERFEIAPDLIRIPANSVIRLGAVGFDDNGVSVPGIVPRWTVLDEGVGTIDSRGVLRVGSEPGVFIGAVRAEWDQIVPD